MYQIENSTINESDDEYFSDINEESKKDDLTYTYLYTKEAHSMNLKDKY
jgi:hypothetical protein